MEMVEIKFPFLRFTGGASTFFIVACFFLRLFDIHLAFRSSRVKLVVHLNKHLSVSWTSVPFRIKVFFPKKCVFREKRRAVWGAELVMGPNFWASVGYWCVWPFFYVRALFLRSFRLPGSSIDANFDKINFWVQPTQLDQTVVSLVLRGGYRWVRKKFCLPEKHIF